jgi:hypothetical protein
MGDATNKQGRIGMERARIARNEVVDHDKRFLTVCVEAQNSWFVLLSEREDKLGTLAIAVPKPENTMGVPPSSIVVGDRYTVSARMFAEGLAELKKKIALLSVYLESVEEKQAHSIFRKLIEKVTLSEPQKEGLIE